MLSFLETIKSRSEGDIDLTYIISEVEKQIDSLNIESENYLQQNASKFSMLLEERESLEKPRRLYQIMKELHDDIKARVMPQLDSGEKYVTQLEKLLEQHCCGLRIVTELLRINEISEKAEDSYQENEYEVTGKLLVSANSCLDGMNKDVKELAVYKIMKTHIEELQDKVLNKILGRWNELVCIQEDNASTLRVIMKVNRTKALSDITHLLSHYENSFNTAVHTLSENILHGIFLPVIKYTCNLEVIKNQHVFVLNADFGNAQCVAHISVLNNLSTVVNFIYEALNIPIQQSKGLLQKISDEYLGERLAQMLTEKYLLSNIPLTQSEFLSHYVKLQNPLLHLELEMKEKGILSVYNTVITDFVENMVKNFIDKVNTTYLENARRLVTTGLHVSKPVHSILKGKPAEGNIEMALCKNALQFPKCVVSQSCIDLFQLVETLIEDLNGNTELDVSRLLHTVRNIIMLYVDLAPIYHDSTITKVSHHAALFYNNCMYLSHGLSLLHMQRNEVNGKLTTYVDLITSLRTLGLSYFGQEISKQRNEMLLALEHGFVSPANSILSLDINRNIEMIMRHLTFLRTAWMDILPQYVYTSTMGYLCSGVISKLVSNVMSMEDIPSSVADFITSVFTQLASNIPQIFPDHKEAPKCIQEWQKFILLGMVVGGKLVDIDKLWENGKGPLADEFTAEEVRLLIRALFQNTERRATVLSRITRK